MVINYLIKIDAQRGRIHMTQKSFYNKYNIHIVL